LFFLGPLRGLDDNHRASVSRNDSLQSSEAQMMLRVLAAATVFSIAGASASAQPASKPRVDETKSRRPVTDDPAINPASGTKPPEIPAAALVDDPRAEEEKRTEGWAVAKWTTRTLQPSAGARHTITVAAPSVLLLRASWAGTDNVTITVVKGGKTLASLTGASAQAGGRLATARVNVPSAGDVVILARGARTAKVTLQVGVLANR
jgi:hypothetical protein